MVGFGWWGVHPPFDTVRRSLDLPHSTRTHDSITYRRWIILKLMIHSNLEIDEEHNIIVFGYNGVPDLKRTVCIPEMIQNVTSTTV